MLPATGPYDTVLAPRRQGLLEWISGGTLPMGGLEVAVLKCHCGDQEETPAQRFYLSLLSVKGEGDTGGEDGIR